MKSRVFEIRVDVTINKGNYESEKIGVSAQLPEGVDPVGEILELKSLAYGYKGLEPVAKTEVSIKEEATVDTFSEKETKKAKISKAKESVAKAEPKIEPQTDLNVEPVEETEEEKPEVKSVVEKQTPLKVKKLKSAASPYDRTNDLHKKLFGEHIDSLYPKWRSNAEVSKKAVSASAKLNGTAFLDAEGLITNSFKDAFATEMN